MAIPTQNSIFSNNLNNLLNERRKTQKEVADAIGVSPQTFNTWCQGIALPRMGKIQKLADYFHVKKSDLIDPTPAATDGILSEEALIVARAYDDADSVDKEIVRRILKIEEKEEVSSAG